jgi:hypothetical protein
MNQQIESCPNLLTARTPTRGLSAKTVELIRYAHRLLEDDNPQTLRQLHYAIFSRSEIPYQNNQADYKRLSRATSVARRSYRAWELATGSAGAPPLAAIPSEWMVDETRQPETVSVWQDAIGYVETVKHAYRRDNWQTQANYCEIWSEKATIMGAIRPIANRLGVTLRVCHGFGSTGMESQVGRMFEDIHKPITVFFRGDHDPSGHIIEEDIHRRVQTASGLDFQMSRLAIHRADISLFQLPPQTIKLTDSRAASFQERFGADAATVELDALPAAELPRRVESAVKGLIDGDIWDRQLAVQEMECKCIAEFAERMKSLPQWEAI